jgi:hypothetical protein
MVYIYRNQNVKDVSAKLEATERYLPTSQLTPTNCVTTEALQTH